MQGSPKICFAPGNFHPFVGGLAKAAYRVVSFLVEAGYDVDVVVPVPGKQSDNLPQPEHREAFKIYRIPMGDSSLAKQSRAIARAVWQLDQTSRYDLFHAFWFSLAFPLSLVSAPRKAPLLASIRGTDAYESTRPEKQGLTKLILHNLNGLTSTNQDLLNRVKKVGGLKGMTQIIPNSVPVADSGPWLLNEANRGVIGTVGKFREVKAVPDLLKAFSLLPRSVAGKLVMVGDFSEAESGYEMNVRSYSEQLELTPYLQWTGLAGEEKVRDYMRQMNLFVLSSKTEGFPNTLLEAAALGLPIVSTKFPGWSDYLKHEKNALMVPVGDPEGLAEAINRVLTHPELAGDLSLGARRFAAKFSPAREKNAWISLYRKLIK
ncbi:MAG TPA: glycosyltransferase family 4 protein [Flavilitoribacter sp.]|nr:glycosyltransferase family 4 protein [Flavilitoribacter sp.]HMQ87366.1 glycosyltransferase family 4 protein [Flavilitoribacter sp.]